MTKTSTPTTITDERKLKVQELLSQGLSQSEIARQLNIDRSAVHYIIKRAAKKGLEPIEAIKIRPNTIAVELICNVLKLKNWTQPQLATALNTSLRNVERWISGKTKPHKEIIEKLNSLLEE